MIFILESFAGSAARSVMQCLALLELVGGGSNLSERAMAMICLSAAVAAAGSAVSDNTVRYSLVKGARNAVGDRRDRSRGCGKLCGCM